MNNVEMHTFVEKLSLENKKKNELFFCISLAYLYLCSVYGLRTEKNTN